MHASRHELQQLSDEMPHAVAAGKRASRIDRGFDRAIDGCQSLGGRIHAG
jgi:hypothetical protein